MKVMVVGSGAREHALSASLARSPRVADLVCAPGNGGTSGIAENVAIAADNVESLVAEAVRRQVELVVIGPEAALVAGLADALRARDILVFGPNRQAATLEGSKAACKAFMARHGIPTAAFGVFEDPDAADAYVRAQPGSLVVKADGLAAGKGVIVTSDTAEALSAVDRIMRKREFGEAGARTVIEERLVGQEVSYHVVLDGTRALPLSAAQDHKRLGDGDTGPNTGGMGAYSPPPVVTPEVERKILSRVVEPTVAGLAADGIEYRGVLFIGLMIVEGEPLVLEYNVRFGDPETQVLMARYGGDLLDLLEGAARGDLSRVTPTWQAPAAMCVVMAAPGYPGSYPKGLPISGLTQAADLPGVSIQHAGTRVENGQIVTAGGRVLGVTAHGADIAEAAARAYAAVDCISFEGAQVRRDIGHHALRKP